MNDDIERIVSEVLSRILKDEPPSISSDRVTGNARILILSENPDEVNRLLNLRETDKNSKFAIFVGGDGSRDYITNSGKEVFYASDPNIKTGDLVDRFEKFLITAVSLNTLSRLAQLIIVDPLVEIVFEALCRSKPVIMDRNIRNISVSKLPSGIKREFSSLFSKLGSYGIREEKITQYIDNTDTEIGVNVPAVRARVRILTVQDLQEFRNTNQNVSIPGPYRLTDLAREYIELNDITIEP